MSKRPSPTHEHRLSLRNTRNKGWREDPYEQAPTVCFRAFSNTGGDRGDSNHPRGRYYEAVTVGRAQGLRTLAPLANEIYTCTRVFTRERKLAIIIGGDALEAAQTTVWLGTNKYP